MAADVEEGRLMLSKGFRCLAFGADIQIYQHGLQQSIAALRESLKDADRSGREVPM